MSKVSSRVRLGSREGTALSMGVEAGCAQASNVWNSPTPYFEPGSLHNTLHRRWIQKALPRLRVSWQAPQLPEGWAEALLLTQPPWPRQHTGESNCSYLSAMHRIGARTSALQEDITAAPTSYPQDQGQCDAHLGV